MLELTVKTLDSNNHSFTLSDEATVLQLKESIFEKIDVPISSQRLIYQGKVLRDEKKLSEYGDVNGKVIHLVERPPPTNTRAADSTTGRRADSSTTGGSNFRRLHRMENPVNYLGSFPIMGHHDFLDGVDIPVRPSQLFARNPLECASRMLRFARQSIQNINSPVPRSDDGNRTNTTNTASTSRPSTVNRGTSTDAAQASSSARSETPINIGDETMTADRSSPATPRRQRTEDGQHKEGSSSDTVTPTAYNEDIASEVEISDSGSSEAEVTPEVRDNSSENRTNRPRTERPDNRARVDAMVPLLTDLENINTELAPHLARCRELLSSENVFDDNSNPTQSEAERIYNSTTEALHNIAHAAHALSELMVDFNEDAPRFLRCRPVVLQHSTILEAGIGMPFESLMGNGPEDGAATPINILRPRAGARPQGASPPQPGPTITSFGATLGPRNTAPPPPPPTETTGPQAPGAPPVPPTARIINPSFGRGPTPVVEFSRVEAIPSFEVFLDYRRPGSGVHGEVPISMFGGEGGQNLQAFAGQIRDQLMGVLNRDNASNPAFAAQAAALASTANLWPNANNPETPADNSSSSAPPPPPPPPPRASETDPMSWLPPIVPTPIFTSTGTNASPEITATGSQTTPPRRRPGVRPVFSMMNMIFQQNFDPALPCSSHHIRPTRRAAAPNRRLWDMFPDHQPPSVRIITRLGGSREAPEGGNPPEAGNSNETPPASDRNFSLNIDLAGLVNEISNSDGTINVPIAEHFFGSPISRADRTPSLVRDFVRLMFGSARVEDLSDFVEARYSSLLNRLRPGLQEFVTRILLQNEPVSPESLARASERVFDAMRPYLEIMQFTRFHTIDLSATINNFNQIQLPDIISMVLSTDTGPEFGENLMERCMLYIRQLIAIIMHCCVDSFESFDTLVRGCVRLLTMDAPIFLRHWADSRSVNHLYAYASSLNIPFEQIERYIVNRDVAPAEVPIIPAMEPMETDGTPPASVESGSPVVNGVSLNTENLPEVLLGSEPWHGTVPSEWVPVIARDTTRQRRQSAQKPLSDAYIAGMPAKRRKLIANSKPQGDTLPQAISEGVRHAIQAAGVSSPIAERAVAEAGHDRSLQKAYKMQEAATIGPVINEDPDFTPSRFPNAHTFFKK